MKKVFGTMAMCLLAAGCQTTGSSQSFKGVAVAGKPLKLGSARAINPDCSSIGTTTIRVLNGPVNGKVSIRHGADFATFGRNNLRSVCNTRRVPSDQLWYVSSKPGATDQVTAEYIYPTGAARTYTYNIEVR